MKRRAGRLARCSVFIILLCMMVAALDQALKPSHEDFIPDKYYQYPADTFDVVFFGASLSMYGILPLQLYNDYGIACYNLCSGNQPFGASYYLIRDVIKRDHPSVIVLDCARAFTDKTSTTSAELHYITDRMPYYSPDRIHMIMELAEEEDRIPLLFPLAAYHSRWQELSAPEDRSHYRESMYGARITGHQEACEPYETPQYMENTISDFSYACLKKIVSVCKETGTSLLLLSMPVPGKEEHIDQYGYNLRWSVAKDISAFAEENGVGNLNLMGREKEIGIDLETDTDDGEHLNRWGAEKLTDSVGSYLCSQYSLADRRGESGIYEEIRQDAENYPLARMQITLHKASSLRHVTNILISDLHDEPVDDVLVLIALGSRVDPEKLGESSGQRLQSIGLSQNLHDWNADGYIAVIDDGSVSYETGSEKSDSLPNQRTTASSGDTAEGLSGQIHYCVTSGLTDDGNGGTQEGLSVLINDEEYAFPDGGLQIFAFQKSTGRLLDACRIDLNSRSLGCEHYEE